MYIAVHSTVMFVGACLVQSCAVMHVCSCSQYSYVCWSVCSSKLRNDACTGVAVLGTTAAKAECGIFTL